LIIYLTGIFELFAAVGLQIPSMQHTTSIVLIIFFMAILPGNIYAAARNINYRKASVDGPGLSYLWFRIPFQFMLIGWIYFFNLYEK
jgi:uncharacterized membrane protein